ncbi:MAG: thrombospondin type 3 repeat-containing protein, partial [Candidatus Levybacteria bacterium]|nr:thrombospondin type 3 repeat-containing protein [Candidatus Levybacteria bacterium]
LFVMGGHAYAQNSSGNPYQIIAKFKDYISIPLITDISTPTAVQMPLPQSLDSYTMALLEVRTGRFLAVERSSVAVKLTPVITTQGSTDIVSLHDSNSTTTFEVQSTGQEKTTTFEYVLPSVISSASIEIVSAPNAVNPTGVSVYALNPVTGEEKLVVSQGKLSGNTLYFPNTASKQWRIVLTHVQPLTLSELSLDEINAKISQAVRFIAQPGQTYYLYVNPQGYVNVPVGESPLSLNTVSNPKLIPAGTILQNPAYASSDSDGDGVSDEKDNCPFIKNSDQDADACSDFDRDGVVQALDNCPLIPNANQEDRDSDNVGDLCDEEESRLTEKYPWIPLVGIVVGFGATLSIFAVTAKSGKK